MSKPLVTASEGTSILSVPVKDAKRDELAQLFLRAAKQPEDWMIGMEVELFGFDRATKKALDYPRVKRLLEVIGERNDMTPEHEASGALIGLKGRGAIMSIEPGGQVEIATKPHKTMKALGKDI